MTFGSWNEVLHQDYEQLKRIIFSQRINPKDIAVSPSSQSARMAGSSGIYDVTLDECTCYDFENRQLPCKHMYRLAYELGYLNDLPKINRKTAKAFKESLPTEIERFKNLYFSGAISGEKLIKIVNALESK